MGVKFDPRAADQHAMIVCEDRVATPSGATLVAKPVDSIANLLKVLLWRRLQWAGLPAQVWIMSGACVNLGWGPDDIDPGDENDYTEEQLRAGAHLDDVIARIDAATAELLGPHLRPDGEDGWHLFQPHGESGWRLHLAYTEGRNRYQVDLFLEGWAWTTRSRRKTWGILGSEADGTLIDDEDDLSNGRELGRRLAWHVAHLGILPGNTPARSGAALADKIWRDRRRRAEKGTGKTAPGAFPTVAVPPPPIDAPAPADVEPAINWVRAIDTQEFEGATRLVSIDQRASYLASAGMINLGLGELTNYAGDAAAEQARADKLPFGVWHVVLPAEASLALPEHLPPPHPLMQRHQDVQAWVTTESVIALTANVASGGAGLHLDDLAIDEAWITHEQGLALKRWKEILADARKAAVADGDHVMKAAVSGAYKGYIGRLANGPSWSAKSLAHHHQPLWRSSIIAHARHRNRVKAMKVAEEFGIWPIKGLTDAWTYLVPDEVDLADSLQYLGKFTVEKDVPLTEETLLKLLETGDEPTAVRAALASIMSPDDAEED